MRPSVHGQSGSFPQVRGQHHGRREDEQGVVAAANAPEALESAARDRVETELGHERLLEAHAWIDENWTDVIANLGGERWARHLGSVAAHPDLALAGVCGVLLAVVVALRGLVSLFTAFDPSTRARG